MPALGEVASKAFSVISSSSAGVPIAFTGRQGDLVDIKPGTSGTRSGFRVSPDGALRIAAVWIANTFIADEFGSLPLKMPLRDDASRVPQQPPRARALWDRPNPDQTLMSFFISCSLSLTLHGNAFVQLGWLNNGGIAQLWPIDPSLVDIQRLDDDTLQLSARGFGDLTNRPGERPEFMHVPMYVMPGEVLSMSPVGYAAELIGESAAYAMASARLAGKGFNPSAVLTVDAEVDDVLAERVARRLERVNSGTNNAGRVAVIGGKDVKLQPLTMSLADAQMVAAREDIFDILMAQWRVPPTVAGMADKTSSWGTGVAEFTRGVERFTLRPIITRFQAGIEDSILRWIDPRLQARFKSDALLSASPTERTQVQRDQVMAGLTSVERVLAQNDEAPFAEDETVYSPLNMATGEVMRLEVLRRRSEVYGALIRAGVDPQAAAQAAGFDAEQLTHLGLAPVTVQPVEGA